MITYQVKIFNSNGYQQADILSFNLKFYMQFTKSVENPPEKKAILTGVALYGVLLSAFSIVAIAQGNFVENIAHPLRYQAEKYRRSIAEKVIVETPDPFINAAVPALNTAGDGVWDEKQSEFMHGAVAWRVKLLGWRGSYLGDALGWHERMRRHLEYWAAQQNTSPISGELPPPAARRQITARLFADGGFNQSDAEPL